MASTASTVFLALVLAASLPSTVARRHSFVPLALEEDPQCPKTEPSVATPGAAVQVTVEHTVAGHTTIGARRVFHLTPDEEEQCNEPLRRITDYIVKDENAGIATAEEEQAKHDIASGNRSKAVLEEIEQVLSIMNLEAAMRRGDVITSEDMNTLVRCETGDPDAAHIMDHDHTESGDTIFEGDIAVPRGAGVGSLAELHASSQWAGRLWPGGKLHWCFRPGTSHKTQRAWRDALNHMYDKLRPFHHQEHPASSSTTCSHSPAVMVQSHEAGCWSYVGMIGGTQGLNIGEWCWTKGIVLHEMAHALGMKHEQSRSDRDSYVTIAWDNIQRGKEHNFDTHHAAYKGDQYDYVSLMHYSYNAFALDRNRGTIVTKSKSHAFDRHTLGQAVDFSPQDWAQLNSMYR